MDFIKYEGLGNDFMVVDVADADAVTPQQAQRWCDRHFGVGADGVLLVSPATHSGSRATMTVLNADGSRPEMCGNGLRCVALHLALMDHVHLTRFDVDTDAGARPCDVHCHDESGEVTIDMGEAIALPNIVHEHAGVSYEFQRISTGNPHAVTFGPPLSVEEIDAFAPGISASIPGGCNIEFVCERGPGQFDLVVWERGVGRTLACGTGAVATAAAAVLSGRAEPGRALLLHLPGGPLSVTLSGSPLRATLSGPARRVFRGQL